MLWSRLSLERKLFLLLTALVGAFASYVTVRLYATGRSAQAVGGATVLDIAVLVFSVVVASVAAATVRRSIVGPLGDVRRHLEAIGSGRYDIAVDTTRRDEIGAILRAISSMRSRLADASTRRAATEELLRRSEERFVLALRASNDGLWAWNLATEEVYLSPRWKQIVGYDEWELENSLSTFRELLHPDDALRVSTLMDDYVSGRVRTFHSEMRLRHKDRHYIHVIGKAACTRDEGGRVARLVGTLTDITERRRSERRLAVQYGATRALSEATTLRQSVASFLKAIGESGGWTAGCAWIAKEDLLESVAVWTSERTPLAAWSERMTKTTLSRDGGSIAATTWTTGAPQWAVALDADEPTAETGLSSGLTVPITFNDRVVGVVQLFSADVRDEDIELLHVLCSINSQIEQALARRQVEKELQAAERKYREIVEHSLDGIYQSTPDGRFLSGNPALARILGYATVQELLDAPAGTAAELYVDGGRRSEFLRQLDAQGVVTSFESQIRRQDGKVIWVSENARVVKHPATGVLLYCEGLIADITGRKEADRMKADFVSFVTHQLRTPLAGIRWMLELTEQQELAEETASYVIDARLSAERLIGLVNDLLDVSRLEAGRLLSAPEPTDLRSVVQSVAAELKPLAITKTHVLVVEPGPDDLPCVMVDPQLVRQAVLNLVSNAIKYTPDGGRITVRLTNAEGQVECSVTDTGIGIPADAQRRLFEKFYRAENASAVDTEGTGLGLYLVRLIIERSGGRLSCESSEGAGSTFRFSLPSHPAMIVEAVA